MKRIYTRTGDRGTTAIHGGQRVAKTDIRIEANGSLDELNTAIGTVRAFMSPGHGKQADLKDIQMTLMKLMSHVATPSAKRAMNPNTPTGTEVADIESVIDRYAAESTPSDFFILPGGTPVSALLHEARTRARRAERALWHLNEIDPVDEWITTYINRLSDLLFVMARHEMESECRDEERWQAFAYRRKR